MGSTDIPNNTVALAPTAAPVVIDDPVQWQAHANWLMEERKYDAYQEVGKAVRQLLGHLGSPKAALQDLHRIGFVLTYTPSASTQAVLKARIPQPTAGDAVAHRLDQLTSSGFGSVAYVGSHAAGASEEDARKALDLGTLASGLLPVAVAARSSLGSYARGGRGVAATSPMEGWLTAEQTTRNEHVAKATEVRPVEVSPVETKPAAQPPTHEVSGALLYFDPTQPRMGSKFGRPDALGFQEPLSSTELKMCAIFEESNRSAITLAKADGTGTLDKESPQTTHPHERFGFVARWAAKLGLVRDNSKTEAAPVSQMAASSVAAQLAPPPDPGKVLAQARKVYLEEMARIDKVVHTLTKRIQLVVFLDEATNSNNRFRKFSDAMRQVAKSPEPEKINHHLKYDYAFQDPVEGYHLVAEPGGKVGLYILSEDRTLDLLMRWNSSADIQPEHVAADPATVRNRMTAVEKYLQSIALDARQRAALPTAARRAIDEALRMRQPLSAAFWERTASVEKQHEQRRQVLVPFENRASPFHEAQRERQARISDLRQQIKILDARIDLLTKTPNRDADLADVQRQHALASQSLADLREQARQHTEQLKQGLEDDDAHQWKLQSQQYAAEAEYTSKMSRLIDSLHSLLETVELSTPSARAASSSLESLQGLIGSAYLEVSLSPSNDVYATLHTLVEKVNAVAEKLNTAVVNHQSTIDGMKARQQTAERAREELTAEQQVTAGLVKGAAFDLVDDLVEDLKDPWPLPKPTAGEHERVISQVAAIEKTLASFNQECSGELARLDGEIEAIPPAIQRLKSELASMKEQAVMQVKDLICDFQAQHAQQSLQASAVGPGVQELLELEL